MGGKLLQIDVSAIKFICEIKKQSTSSVHLSNVSDEYVAFKVKTTSPKRFCVRPNSGIISPKSAFDFTVTMQGLRSAPSEVECKDKFLIQSTVVDAGTKEEDVTLELFSKSSGKRVEEKKLRVILESKQDSSSDEHKPSNESSTKEENVVKNKVSEKEPSNESLIKKENGVKNKVSVKEPSNESTTKEENVVKNKVSEKEPSNESTTKEENVVKNKVSEKEPPNESSIKEENVVKNEVLGKEPSHGSPIKEENVVKNKVSEKEPSNESLIREEDMVKDKVLGKKPSNESSSKEENVVKDTVLGKEPSNESSTKEKNVVKKDKNALPMHTQIEDSREVKGELTTEDQKASADLDINEGNLSKNLKSNPVKVMKEDPQRKLRLHNQLKELKLKETTLENQLKEAKSTISSLTYQNSIIFEAKEKLKLELDRRSKNGYPFTVVCVVSLIGLISGYISDP